MTAFSAKVDEDGNWFDTRLPGRLSDVFVLKVNAFYQTSAPISYTLDGKSYQTDANFYEVPEPSTARTLAQFNGLQGNVPAITVNDFGKGQAIYLALPSSHKTMQPILQYLTGTLGLHRGPQTSEGVYARFIDSRTLYVNSTTSPQTVLLARPSRLTLTNTEVQGSLELKPYEAELVEDSTSVSHTWRGAS